MLYERVLFNMYIKKYNGSTTEGIVDTFKSEYV